jgi:hypothetical protein
LRRSGFVMAELPLSRERTSPVEHITTLKNLVLDPNTIDRYLRILHENSISADQPTVGAVYIVRCVKLMANTMSFRLNCTLKMRAKRRRNKRKRRGS